MAVGQLFNMLIIIQARMGSSRLPGKILKEVCGMPSIIYQINRIKIIANNKIHLVVATTTNSKDDVLCDLLEKNKVSFFRGSENDVLKRFLDCAKLYEANYITRINADCPLICPEIIDKTVKKIMSNKSIDYASTILDETFPLGMHVECFKTSVLGDISKTKLTLEDREHVTPGIYRNKKYSLCSIRNNQNKSNFRLTVDFAIDLEVVNEIASSFKDNTYNCNDIVKFLENNPEIAMKNLELIKKQKL